VLVDLSSTERTEFLRIVRIHGLSGLTLERLRSAEDPSLDALVQGLEPGARRAMALGLRLQRACREVSAILSGADVAPVAPIKGVALHACLYGSVGARNATDVDLLIPPESADRAHQALVEAGYSHVIKDPARPSAMAVNYENSYLGPDGVLMDVHVGLAQVDRVDLDAAGMLQRAVMNPQLEPWGSTLVQLDPEDTLLILAVHLAQDAYQGPFRQLVDLAWCWARMEPDIIVAATRARKAGAATALWAGLWLARERCGAEVSDGDLALVAPARIRQRWLRWLWGEAPLTPIPWRKGSRLVQVATLYPVMDGGRRRARFTWRYLRHRLRDWVGLAPVHH
jgi:hypothetical protein